MQLGMRWALALTLFAGCGGAVGQRVVINGQTSPLAVRIEGGHDGGGEGPGTWVNDCVRVARLGAQEPLTEWLNRVETVIEESRDHLHSVSYPPAAATFEVALVCFSTHAL